MPHLFLLPALRRGPKGSIAQICGIQYGMNKNKFELADLILRYLYQQKEQGKSIRHSIETLTERLNKHNDGFSVTEKQVYAAVEHLYDHQLVKGYAPSQNSFIISSITPKGEDTVVFGPNVQEANRLAVRPQGHTINTTINGNVNQFAQGDNNTQIQNNHVETADELFEKLIELLKQNGETQIADEAKAEKESGGIHKAAKFISDKIFGGFLTKLSQDGAQQVMAVLPAITAALAQ